MDSLNEPGTVNPRKRIFNLLISNRNEDISNFLRLFDNLLTLAWEIITQDQLLSDTDSTSRWSMGFFIQTGCAQCFPEPAEPFRIATLI